MGAIYGRGELEEVFRLARVERGKGRVVRRFIERHCEQGEFELRLDLQAGWGLVGLACLTAYMRRFIEGLANADGGWVREVEVFPWTSRMSMSYVVKVGDVPAAMADRQAMLREVYERLDLVIGVHEEWSSPGAADELLALYLNGGAALSQTEAARGAFEQVVRGVYTGLPGLGPKLAALAATLNTQVKYVMPNGWSVEPSIEEAALAG